MILRANDSEQEHSEFPFHHQLLNRWQTFQNVSIISKIMNFEPMSKHQHHHHQQHHRQSHYKRRMSTTTTTVPTCIHYCNHTNRHNEPQFVKSHPVIDGWILQDIVKSPNREDGPHVFGNRYHCHNDAPRDSLRHRVERCKSIFLCMMVVSLLQCHLVYGDDDTSLIPPFPTTTTSGSTAPTAPPAIQFNVTVSTTPNRNVTRTNAPTPIISDTPTTLPSNEPYLARSLYRQGFLLPVSNTQIFLNDTEIESFTSILESYTPIIVQTNNITSDFDSVLSNCTIILQSGSTNALNRTINEIDYQCQYESQLVDVVTLPTDFLTYMNGNLNQFTTDLQENNININASLPASILLVPSPAPSISPPPTTKPSLHPTVSTLPSYLPSALPTEVIQPTTDPDFFVPTDTIKPSTPGMEPDISSNSSSLSVGGIVAIVITGGLLCLAGLYLYYRSVQKRRTAYHYSSNPQQRHEQRSQRRFHHSSNNNSTLSTGMTTTTAASGSRRHFLPTFRPNRPMDNTFAARPSVLRYNNSHTTHTHEDIDAIHNPANYVISPTDSHLSNKSLLSTGDSVIAEGSGDNDYDHHNIDEDGTKHLQDEFDLYKDQNLELLRTDVECNLSGFEGFMSAAVTNAFFGDDEKKTYEMQELLWGCDTNPDGTEIEASVLFEVTDWLNRNESAGMERKGVFMQEILNKMVTSVRFGVIVAEDAARTIHESAAILGLALAEDLPVTTVIISGMRKTTRASDIITALNEFGDIDVAAVASGKRGFGIVRFRRRISVDHALQQYRAGEIVILDVSIQMKVLMPNGVLESR